MGKSPAEFITETVIDQHNVSAWHQSQRIQLRKEELAIQREELKLKRDIFERDSCEWIVKMYNNPTIRAIALDETQTFSEKVSGVNKIMFGSKNTGETKSEGQGSKSEPDSNVQHSTLASQAHHQMDAPNVEIASRSVVNAKHSGQAETPTSKLQAPEKDQTSSSNEGDGNVPEPANAKGQQNGHEDAVEQVAASPSVAPGYGQNESTDVESERGALLCEPGNGNAQSNAPRPDAAGESSPGEADKPQSSEKGSMTEAEANRAIQAWVSKAKSLGIFRPTREDSAALKAYLTNRDWKRYSLKTRSQETLPPPVRDPRFDPPSSWCGVWKKLQQHEAAQLKQNEKN
jgi:hypothetical protein